VSAVYAAVAGCFARERQRELLAEAARWRLAEAARGRLAPQPSLRRAVGRALIQIGIRLAPDAPRPTGVAR
jgi:hypothetical protein